MVHIRASGITEDAAGDIILLYTPPGTPSSDTYTKSFTITDDKDNLYGYTIYDNDLPSNTIDITNIRIESTDSANAFWIDYIVFFWSASGGCPFWPIC